MIGIEASFSSVTHGMTENLFTEVQHFRGINGWLRAFFGSAICIEEEVGNSKRTLYLDKTSLVQKLFITGNEGKDAFKGLENISRVHELLIRTLNPIKGKPIPAQAIQNIFNKFRKQKVLDNLENASTQEEVIEIIEARLEKIQLKERNVKVIPYDVAILEQQLQPGDLIFKKIHEENHNSIVTAQKVQYALLSGNKDRAGMHYSHVVMCVGDGKIAEAAWPSGKGDEIRIIKLEDTRFALPETGDLSRNEYLVVRMTDQALAQKAIKVAKKIATELEPEDTDSQADQTTPIRYSIPLAAKALLFDRSFGLYAKYRYMKQYHDSKKDGVPMDFMNPQDFFCSYLIAYCLQVAEAKRILPKVISAEDLPSEGFTSFGTAIFRGIWARIKTWQNFSLLDKEVKIQLNAKRTSPQVFRNFVVNNPDMFEEKFLISRVKKADKNVAPTA